MSHSNGPVALVTGAGSGIGLAVCELLAAEGWRLGLAGRRSERLDAAAQAAAVAGAEAEAIVADVSLAAQARGMVERAAARFGRIDALVNNAGSAPLCAIDRTTPELLERTFAVNALGPANAIAAAWPHMVRQGGGRIVNVSTMGTKDPFPGFFAYAASKAAVNLMARSCANEGRSHGIFAFAVAPGAVETGLLREIFDEQMVPTERCLSPRQVAEVVVACATGRRDADSGEVIWLASP